MNIRTMALLSALSLPGLYACKSDSGEKQVTEPDHPAQSDRPYKSSNGLERPAGETARASDTTKRDLAYDSEKSGTRGTASAPRPVEGTQEVDRPSTDAKKLAVATGVLGEASFTSSSESSLSGSAYLTRVEGTPRLVVNLTNASSGPLMLGIMSSCPRADSDDKIKADDVKNLGSITVGRDGKGSTNVVLTKDMIGSGDIDSLDGKALVLFPSNTVSMNTSGAGDTSKSSKKSAEKPEEPSWSASSVAACAKMDVHADTEVPGI